MRTHFSSSSNSIRVPFSFFHAESYQPGYEIFVGYFPIPALPDEAAVFVDIRIGIYVDNPKNSPVFPKVYPEISPASQACPRSGGEREKMFLHRRGNPVFRKNLDFRKFSGGGGPFGVVTQKGMLSLPVIDNGDSHGMVFPVARKGHAVFGTRKKFLHQNALGKFPEKQGGPLFKLLGSTHQ